MLSGFLKLLYKEDECLLEKLDTVDSLYSKSNRTKIAYIWYTRLLKVLSSEKDLAGSGVIRSVFING